MGRIGIGKVGAAAVFFALLAGLTYAQEVFRVDVKLVRVVATVRDNTGAVVGGLTQADFSVFDNGVKQQIALFERHTSQPLSVAVLVDTSGSTGKEIRYETDSVSRFARTLFGEGNPQDTASLYTFDWQVVQHLDYARRPEAFDRVLRKLKGEAGTALYDGLYLASGELKDRQGRHVVVVVTDGGDTVSSKTYAEALRSLHDADAVLYAILVMPITNDAGRNVGGENALTGLAQSTGGKMFAPAVNGLDLVFDEILKDLRTQYLLGFYPRGVAAAKDPFHKLTIQLAKPNLRVLARTGYYGDSEAPSRR